MSGYPFVPVYKLLIKQEMNAKSVINFEGLTFLDKLETMYGSEGMEGVIKLVEMQFPIGQPINLNQRSNQPEEEIFMIESVTISTIHPDVVLWSMGDAPSGSIIRSIHLPYVDTPFEISIYGSPKSAGNTIREEG